MSELYTEMSRGKPMVTGQVHDWVHLPEGERFYAGPPAATASATTCSLASLTTALEALDASIDFSRFDNNGPDNQPNTADDDGFVDFAFVHPTKGGECRGTGNNSIWSHRFSLQSLIGDSFETDDPNASASTRASTTTSSCRPSPATVRRRSRSGCLRTSSATRSACRIRRPARARRVGGHRGMGLMGSGSWGGDGHSHPEKPTHMIEWSKEFLGWVDPVVIEADTAGVEIPPARSCASTIRTRPIRRTVVTCSCRTAA